MGLSKLDNPPDRRSRFDKDLGKVATGLFPDSNLARFSKKLSPPILSTGDMESLLNLESVTTLFSLSKEFSAGLKK